MMRFYKLNRSGEIAIAIGIIFAKRKGGIVADPEGLTFFPQIAFLLRRGHESQDGVVVVVTPF